jgi:serine/threonine-protein kinase HipA
MTKPTPYKPSDRLYLWLLTRPEQPLLVAELNMARSVQGVSLRYADSWLERGFPLSEDLPLIGEEFLPTEKGMAAGAVDDARPDRWGERVIRFIDKPPRLSLLEYLYFAGDDRFGALGVSTSAEEYLPRRLGPLPTLDEADQIHELIRKVQDNEPVPPEQKRLISPGVTMGGAPQHRRRSMGDQVRGRRTHRHTPDRTCLDDARAESGDSGGCDDGGVTHAWSRRRHKALRS